MKLVGVKIRPVRYRFNVSKAELLSLLDVERDEIAIPLPGQFRVRSRNPEIYISP